MKNDKIISFIAIAVLVGIIILGTVINPIDKWSYEYESAADIIERYEQEHPDLDAAWEGFANLVMSDEYSEFCDDWNSAMYGNLE